MKFDNNILKYLNGELFSAGLDIKFNSEKYQNLTRIEKIIEIVKDKRVIHIGCADHLPLIEEKIKNKKWLHGLLIENTTMCVGIDINKDAVDFINKNLNIENVYNLNILTDKIEQIENKSWDYILLGEIIEHIDNPVQFLQQIKKKYSNNVSNILITAPNVYNLLTIKDIKKNIENINTDHRYWFSPYTLTKLIINSEFQDCNLSFAEPIKLPIHLAIIKRLKYLFNIPITFNANCFSSIIIEAKFVHKTK